MRSVAAVRSRHNVAARSGRTPGASMAKCAAIGQARADRKVGVDVAHPVFLVRALSLQMCEFSLEELASAPDRAERIAVDRADRRSRRIHIAATRADLIE